MLLSLIKPRTPLKMKILSEFEMTDIFIIFHYKYTFINLIFKRLNKHKGIQANITEHFLTFFFSKFSVFTSFSDIKIRFALQNEQENKA